jgi:hypothetical protein
MNTKTKLGTATALAVACSAWFGGCQNDRSGLVVLKTYISTNTVPGYIGGPHVEPSVGPDGYLMPQMVNAVAIHYPPKTNVVTNYVIGYRAADGKSVEVLRVP